MKNSINGFLLTPLLFLGMQMAVASPSYLVPPPLSPTTATNCFSDGTKTIRSQATAVLPNGLPLVAVVRANFNCGSFQIMCYNTASSIAAFDSCINQKGTILKNKVTVPKSKPDDICIAFDAKAKMSGIGTLNAYYATK